MHLGIIRFLIEIFQQDQRLFFLRISHHFFQPRLACGHAHLLVLGEMVARVHFRPTGAELDHQIDVTLQIIRHRIRHNGRVLGDIDGRAGVQSQLKLMLGQKFAHGCTALPVELVQRVVPRIELNVDVLQTVFCGPRDGVFQFQAAADVDADAVYEFHGVSPAKLANKASNDTPA